MQRTKVLSRRDARLRPWRRASPLSIIVKTSLCVGHFSGDSCRCGSVHPRKRAQADAQRPRRTCPFHAAARIQISWSVGPYPGVLCRTCFSVPLVSAFRVWFLDTSIVNGFRVPWASLFRWRGSLPVPLSYHLSFHFCRPSDFTVHPLAFSREL